MRRNSLRFVGTRFLFAVAAGSLVSLPAARARAADAVVPGDFATIAAAIQGATDGDGSGTVEIFVMPGTYFENLLVRRSNLKLEGASPATTTIRGAMSVDTIRVENASNVTVTGFTIMNSGGADGIEFSDVTSSTISGNVFDGNVRGISLGRSSNNTIRSNEVRSSVGTGIKLARRSDANLVELNVVHDNGNHGIDAIGVAGNTIIHNSCGSNAGNGMRIGKTLGNRVESNVVTASGNNGIRIGRNFDLVLLGNSASGSRENGLRMDETTRTIVSENSFTGNGEFGVRRKLWIDDDFDGVAPGFQDPPGSNDLSGNVRGPLRED